MSKVSSNSPQGQGKTVAAVSEQSSPNKPSRPGWLEIVVGLVIYAIVAFVGVSQLKRIGLDPGAYGLILTSWAGVATLIAFVVAALATAEIFRRSGSIWPGFVVHVVFNLPSFLLVVFTSTG